MLIAAAGETIANPYSVVPPSTRSRSTPTDAADAFSSVTSESSEGGQSEADAGASHSLSGIALAVQLSADQMAALQSDLIQAPDPAKTEAQNNDKAFALIKDAKTGEVVGGVWPNAAIVSGPDIAHDSRLWSDSNMSEVTQYLAQDIQKATGNPVTIQYFQPGDPNAPTFGNRADLIS